MLAAEPAKNPRATLPFPVINLPELCPSNVLPVVVVRAPPEAVPINTLELPVVKAKPDNAPIDILSFPLLPTIPNNA